MFGTCTKCGLDFSCHSGAHVTRETLEATRLMIDLIHPDPERHSSVVASLHTDLSELNRGDVFELSWRLGCVLTGQDLRRRDNAASLSVTQRIEILEAGSVALRDWPNSFNRAIKGQIGSSGGTSVPMLAGLRRTARSQGVSLALKALLRRSAPELFASTAVVVKSALKRGANSREMEEILEVSQKVVERLRKTQHLPSIHATGQVNSHRIYEGGGQEQLKDLIKDTISVGSICEKMAISRHGIEQLVCLGEIEMFDEGPVSEIHPKRHARRSDYLRLVERLTKAAVDFDQDCRLPIRRAMNAIGGREKPWGPAILAMLSGDMPFNLDPSEGKFLSNVSINKRDLPKLMCLEFDRSEFPDFSFENMINSRDTEELLNIFAKTTCPARRDGSLPELVEGAQDREVILDLAAKHISLPEILARWNGRDKRLPAPFQGPHRLLKISALGWDREAAENAMAKAGVRTRAQYNRHAKP